eukprot:scaffold105972_cov72-Phaeocystis_antarctica.AAC.2
MASDHRLERPEAWSVPPRRSIAKGRARHDPRRRLQEAAALRCERAQLSERGRQRHGAEHEITTGRRNCKLVS